MAEVVGAILIDGGNILLGLRAPHKSFAGCWDVIGGHVEPGETPWSALRRELSEELGIECREGRRIATVMLPCAGRPTVVLHIYAVRSWLGEPSVRNDEHAAIGWFTLQEACALHLASSHYRRLFASLREPEPR
ncbi:NUDIX domain-containing protein [Methylobacterium oryzisoli]|uniref:NUDIX domain-containing protein n=1 Tax=Methylobacterium oryzisoli TaxID=3385502 RepID=UPI00389262DE